MITSRIQIENGVIDDFYTKWGFIYLVGDHRYAAPEKKRDKSSHPGQAGVNEDPRTVDDEFDYNVTFLIEAPNKDLINANSKITAWNNAVRERIAGSDIKRCKTVTFYDDLNRSKIVGIPEIIDTADDSDFFRRRDGSVLDCVVINLVIHVNSPSLCEFDISNDYLREGGPPA